MLLWTCRGSPAVMLTARARLESGSGLLFRSMVILVAMLVIPYGHFVRAAGTPPHVLIVLMENHSYEAIVGNPNMPYVNGLVATNGSVSTTDLTHPSEPNYLGLTSGSIYDNPQDLTPQDETYPGPQFTDELAGASIGWKAYMEDMPVACDLTDTYSPGNYDVNHNPFMYFNSVRNTPSQCNRVVPYPQLTTDLNAGTAPPFLWVTPNTINDGHDGNDQTADNYLKGLVTQVQASTWWTAGSRIIITWDEGTQSEQVLTLVVGSAHGTQANGGNEYGTLRGLEVSYGVGLLGHSADSNVGDILPLLTGATAAPPSPSPSPSPPPSPSPSPSPRPSPSASPAPSPTPPPGPSSVTRGIYRFASTDFAAMQSAGFNAATDGGVQGYGDAEAAAGITGMVWVPAYDNTTCVQTMTDSAIAGLVQANVGAGHLGLRYQIGDEPTANGCLAAPVYANITQVVHGADATAKTWVADDQFQVGNPVVQGVPMKGSVDILAFDVYPCESGPCAFSAIDSAVQQIHAANLTNWEFIIQDFNSSPWRWPNPTELQTQFDHWTGQGASGYWVFAWDYQGQQVTSQTGNLAAMQVINSLAINSRSPSPSSSPSMLSVSASANRTAGNSRLAVSFASTPSGGVAPYGFAWTFGDGGISSLQNPSYTYISAGTFGANLTVTDSNGARAASNTVTITVDGSGSAGTITGSSPPVVQQPAPPEQEVTSPTPTTAPSGEPSVSPPVAPGVDQNSGSGSGGSNGTPLVLMLIGSLFATGLGGALFLGWLRRRG